MLDAAEQAGRRAPRRPRVPVGARACGRRPRDRGRASSASPGSRRSCRSSAWSPTPRPGCPAGGSTRRRAGLAGRLRFARRRPGARLARRLRVGERGALGRVGPHRRRRRHVHGSLPAAVGCRGCDAADGRGLGADAGLTAVAGTDGTVWIDGDERVDRRSRRSAASSTCPTTSRSPPRDARERRSAAPLHPPRARPLHAAVRVPARRGRRRARIPTRSRCRRSPTGSPRCRCSTR